MRQAEIEEEVQRQINEIFHCGKRIVDIGKVIPWFGPAAAEIYSDVYFKTEGDPPLEMMIVERDGEQKAFDVHITHIGDRAGYDSLEIKPVPPVDECLPDRIFVADDIFKRRYEQCLPRSAVHYHAYTEICRELKPTTILEIGVRAGYSAWAMLKAVPDATYMGIDADNATNGGVHGYMWHAEDMLRREYPAASVTMTNGDSQQLISLSQRYDLIHIDAAHNHDQALHDIELCAPHADYLLVDDTNSISTVRSALIEFLDARGYKAWRYDTWHGLVLIDTRPAKGTQPACYAPAIFNPPTMEAARSIILQEGDDDLTTDLRWQTETDWLMQHIAFPPGIVFDIGCGIGRLALPLIKRRSHQVIGVDFSPSMRSKADEYVGDGSRFAVISPEMFAGMADKGLRGQGALAVWVLQHMLPEDLVRMLGIVRQALVPGAWFYTMDSINRCVPCVMHRTFGWLNDGFDVVAAMEREGFAMHTSESPPENIYPPGQANLRCWIRKRE